jgi:hypothetical protein
MDAGSRGEGGEELHAAADEQRIGRVEQQGPHLGGEAVARRLVPFEQLEGVGAATPQLNVAGVEREAGGQVVLGDAAGDVGDRREQAGLEPDVGDSGRLVSDDVAGQAGPLRRRGVAHDATKALTMAATTAGWVRWAMWE